MYLLCGIIAILVQKRYINLEICCLNPYHLVNFHSRVMIDGCAIYHQYNPFQMHLSGYSHHLLTIIESIITISIQILNIFSQLYCDHDWTQ